MTTMRIVIGAGLIGLLVASCSAQGERGLAGGAAGAAGGALIGAIGGNAALGAATGGIVGTIGGLLSCRKTDRHGRCR